MGTVKKSLKQHRVFSEDIKKQVIRDIEKGRCTVRQASRELQVSEQSIYNWLNRYSLNLQRQRVLVVENKSEAYRTKELQKRIQELEAALGRKQMEVDLLNKILEMASEEQKVDIKKNILRQLSNGTDSKKA
jgi:transposase